MSGILRCTLTFLPELGAGKERGGSPSPATSLSIVAPISAHQLKNHSSPQAKSLEPVDMPLY